MIVFREYRKNFTIRVRLKIENGPANKIGILYHDDAYCNNYYIYDQTQALNWKGMQLNETNGTNIHKECNAYCNNYIIYASDASSKLKGCAIKWNQIYQQSQRMQDWEMEGYGHISTFLDLYVQIWAS